MDLRIRSLKPSIREDEKVGTLSLEARLCYIMLLTVADDHGRLRYNPAYVRAECYRYDEVTLLRVQQWLGELTKHGFLLPYEVNGESFAVIKNWNVHQYIKVPSESKLPEPPADLRRACGVYNGVDGETFKEGEQDEELGKDIGGQTSDSNAADVRRVWEVYLAGANKDGRYRLTSEKRKKIQTALKNYPLDDVLAAVQGWKYSPYHRGGNPDGRVWNEITLLLRNGEKIEYFRDCYNRNASKVVHLRGESSDTFVDNSPALIDQFAELRKASGK